MNDDRFFETAVGDRFRGFVLSLLQTDLKTLSPEQISSFIGWSLSGRIELAEPIGGRKQMDASEIPAQRLEKDRRQVARALEQDGGQRRQEQSQPVAGQIIYGARFSDSELLPFLRERIEAGPKEFKLSYISALFDTLIGRKWSDENEKEAFALLPQADRLGRTGRRADG